MQGIGPCNIIASFWNNGEATMKSATRNLLLATLSSLSLAAAPALAEETFMAAPAIAAGPLTESVPSQLPRIARPSHYDIAVTPDAKALTFTGRVAIDL